MRRILCIVLILMTFLVSKAQQMLVMPAHEVIDTVLCEFSPVTITNPPSTIRNLGLRCTGGVLLDALTDPTVKIHIEADICDPSTQLIVFDGNDVYSPIVGVITMSTGHQTRDYRARSGYAFIQYVSMGTNTCSETFMVTASRGVDIQVQHVNSFDAIFSLHDEENRDWTIHYGTHPNNLDHHYDITENNFSLDSLHEYSRYYYRLSRTGDSIPNNNRQCPVPSFRTNCYTVNETVSRENDLITIEWDDSTDSLDIIYGGSTMDIGELPYSISNISSPTFITDYARNRFCYRIFPSSINKNLLSNHCIERRIDTDPGLPNAGCIDFTDFEYGGVRAYTASWGTYLQNYIDCGQWDYNRSTHTVNYEQAIDPTVLNYFGDTLWVIPPGEILSVRLGRTVAGRNKYIHYPLTVDTRTADILILKYAMVLEAPWSHSPEQRPHLNFYITNTMGERLNSDCSSASFYPGSESTSQWHGTGEDYIVWQDWTTMAIDLTPYDGQTINLNIEALDCLPMAHYSYVYYTISCAHKTITTNNCGDNISDLLTAPKGFTYRWFEENDPNTILSTSDTLHTDIPGIYHCLMSFKSQNPEAECVIESKTINSTKYPWARFSYTLTEDWNCKKNYIFTNNSVITRDPDHTMPIDIPCEKYEWIIDNNIHYERNEISHYFPSGAHKVQLVAKLNGSQCTDTTTQYINVDYICFDTIRNEHDICEDSSFLFFDTILRTSGEFSKTHADTVELLTLHVHQNKTSDSAAVACDSFYWKDNTYFESGEYNTMYQTTYNCDSIVKLHLTINKSNGATILDTCIENNLPHQYKGKIIYNAISDTQWLNPNIYGCDSITTYSLYVWRNVTSAFDTAVCPENLPLEWRDVWFDNDGIRTQFVPGGASHGEDSTATLSLSLYPNYIDSIYDTVLEINLPHYYMGHQYTKNAAFDSFYSQSIHGCDSILYYSLFIHLSAIACDRFLQFPNIVTPNGDGRNDRFTVVNLLELQCYEHTQLIIYNRWGIPVYNAKDIRRKEDFWDPAATHSPAGTYYYHFEAHGARGRLDRHGVVEVIR